MSNQKQKNPSEVFRATSLIKTKEQYFFLRPQNSCHNATHLVQTFMGSNVKLGAEVAAYTHLPVFGQPRFEANRSLLSRISRLVTADPDSAPPEGAGSAPGVAVAPGAAGVTSAEALGGFASHWVFLYQRLSTEGDRRVRGLPCCLVCSERPSHARENLT